MKIAANVPGTEHQESAIPFLRIEEGELLTYRFEATELCQLQSEDILTLIYKPGDYEEKIIQSHDIVFTWDRT